jgi:hypothetical protein
MATTSRTRTPPQSRAIIAQLQAANVSLGTLAKAKGGAKLAARKVAKATPAAAVEADRPMGSLLKGNISDRLGNVLMHAYDAEGTAHLLETISGKGYSEASHRDNAEQKKLWGMAAYIGRTLERTAAELQREAEDLEKLAVIVAGDA